MHRISYAQHTERLITIWRTTNTTRPPYTHLTSLKMRQAELTIYYFVVKYARAPEHCVCVVAERQVIYNITFVIFMCCIYHDKDLSSRGGWYCIVMVGTNT